MLSERNESDHTRVATMQIGASPIIVVIANRLGTRQR